MSYSELIKNFERIRGYMKDFYVYGFKTREEYDDKSARSYDNEKRRIENYLGDYMGFHRNADGKNVFISIDSRNVSRNPLYKAFKAKSFTNGDITLHFIIFDILNKPENSFTLSEITKKIDEYMSFFTEPMSFDESTVRKKLKEYCELGLVKVEKRGKQVHYHRAESIDLSCWSDALEFYSEAGACGVIGNFLLDKTENNSEIFSFKHHYITHALDSEIIATLLSAITRHQSVEIVYDSAKKRSEDNLKVVPLKIFVSVQNGRQYLIAYVGNNHFTGVSHNVRVFRLDFIKKAIVGEFAEDYLECLESYENIRKHMWGVSIGNINRLEHIEFTIHIGDNEEYIYQRLVREKRCGEVVRLDEHTALFYADVYDAYELSPWIRSFICRIKRLNFSDPYLDKRFKKDIETMYEIYGIGGGE